MNYELKAQLLNYDTKWVKTHVLNYIIEVKYNFKKMKFYNMFLIISSFFFKFHKNWRYLNFSFGVFGPFGHLNSIKINFYVAIFWHKTLHM